MVNTIRPLTLKVIRKVTNFFNIIWLLFLFFFINFHILISVKIILKVPDTKCLPLHDQKTPGGIQAINIFLI